MNRLAEPTRRHFTRIEVAVIVAVVILIGCVVLPAILAARESARRMSCSNNFKQIGLGIHNYHSAFNCIPPTCSGTGPTPHNDDLSNQRRLSGNIPMICFLESSSLWEMICNRFITDPSARDDVTRDELYSKKLGGYSADFLDRFSTSDGPLLNEKGEHFFPAMGPAPWRAAVYPPWQIGMMTFHCPSSPTERPSQHAALSNYAFCYGDGINEVGYEPGSFLSFRNGTADTLSQRGPFVNGKVLEFSDCSDGLSNTLFMAEVATSSDPLRMVSNIASNIEGLKDNPSLCLATSSKEGRFLSARYKEGIRVRSSRVGQVMRGGNWADGAIPWSGFNTVLPPNSPSCDTQREQRLEGVFSASSDHDGGCHVLFGDGAVRFVTNTIDTGNLTAPSVYSGSNTPPEVDSPYGVWGSLGTRSASAIAAFDVFLQ